MAGADRQQSAESRSAAGGVVSSLLWAYTLSGRGIERIERGIAAGLMLVQTVLGRVFAPISAAVGSVSTGQTARSVTERFGGVSDNSRDRMVGVERWLAVRLPQFPAPTVTTDRFGEIPTRYLVGGVGFLGLLAVPGPLTAFQLSEFIFPVYLMAFAMSWDIVSGYTGEISLGHTVFFALGGYTTTVLNLQHGLSPALSIPLGVVVAGLGGILIGYPALRIKGPYLSLVTLIAPIILLQLVILFNSELPIIAPQGLGGVNGFVAANDPLVGTASSALITVPSFAWQVIIDYYLAVAVFTVILAVLLLVTRTNTGEILTAIRENEDAVAAAGLNTAKFKLFAFVLSGVVGGLAGAAFVHSSAGNPINPQQILDVGLAINIVIMSIFGGMGTIVGAAVGAVFFVAATALFDAFGAAVVIPILGESLASLMPVPLLIIALLVVVFKPKGLVPVLIRAGRWLASPAEERLADERP